ncbi:hypothetical protein Asp14428_33250 [Actinoplanes sp. NBRC 14428]|nr:hypothetical protein Asp14428_33250 [Actinoplanes sp. NBRC 14428]
MPSNGWDCSHDTPTQGRLPLSTTPEPADSEYTAGLIAQALITEASRSPEHRRLYLTGHLGLRPPAIFEALRRYLQPEAAIEVTTPSGPIRLEAAPLGNQTPAEAILVPYLVGSAGPNSGTAGFAAFLRDEVPVGDIPRVLLILDEQPVETVRTAAEDAGLLDGLQWPQMISAAIASAPAAIAPLLQAVRNDLNARTDRVRRDYIAIGTLRRLAACVSASEAGAGLYRLGCYVSDPDAISSPRQRLKASQGWRDKLDAWSAPDQNLEARLIGEYEDQHDARLARVLEARTPFGLDFSQFVLADLPAARGASVRSLKLASPIRARGAACASQPGRAVLWAPGGTTFSIMLMRPAATAATATMIWADGGTPARSPIAAGDREIAFDLNGDGWRFARLELSSGERAELAIFFDAGQWAPFEGSIDLDFATAAFRCHGDPDLWAMDPAGRLIGQPDPRATEADCEDGEPRRYLAVLGSQSRPIDLVVGVAAGEGEEPGSGPAEPSSPPEPGDPDDYPAPPRAPDDDDGDFTGRAPGRFLPRRVRCRLLPTLS